MTYATFVFIVLIAALIQITYARAGPQLTWLLVGMLTAAFLGIVAVTVVKSRLG